jgi:hypothetical protein
MGLACVSVHLFSKDREKLLGLCRALEQFVAESDRRRWIVIVSHLEEIGELGELRRGRVFRKLRRRTLRGGTSRDLVAFLDAVRSVCLRTNKISICSNFNATWFALVYAKF